MKMRKGTKVRFSLASGNSTVKIMTIAGSEKHNGMKFFRLSDMQGLFLASSLVCA